MIATVRLKLPADALLKKELIKHAVTYEAEAYRNRPG